MRILAIDIESGHTAELLTMGTASVGDYDPIYFSADEQYFYLSLNRRNGVIRWADLEA
jgi:hypothetical protein